MSADPRFKTNDLRAANQKILREIIQEWISSMPSDEEVLRILEEHHIPCAPVLTVEEVVNNPILRERGSIKIINDPIVGEVAVPGFPMRFADTPAVEDLPTAFLGEHNAMVLREYLGYATDEIEDPGATGNPVLAAGKMSPASREQVEDPCPCSATGFSRMGRSASARSSRSRYATRAINAA